MVAQTSGAGGNVREARRADIDGMAPIWIEFMREHEQRDSHFKLAQDGLARWRALVSEMLFREDGFVFVGEHDGQIAGYCLGWLARNPPIYSVTTVGFISELAVRASERRQGVGRELIASARCWFDDREISEFQLATAIWNEGAQSFWKRVGGRPILTRYRFEV